MQTLIGSAAASEIPMYKQRRGSSGFEQAFADRDIPTGNQRKGSRSTLLGIKPGPKSVASFNKEHVSPTAKAPPRNFVTPRVSLPPRKCVSAQARN